MAPPPQSCTVILPAFNEGPSLPQLIDEIVAVAPAAGLSPLTLLIIDDGSTDDTWPQIKTAAETSPASVLGIRLRRNCGKSAALAVALSRVNTELVATLDADGQDDPAALTTLRETLDQGADLVTGWKSTRRDPWTRRAASGLFNLSARLAFGTRLKDMNSGLKLMRANVAADLAEQLTSDLHRYQPIIAHSLGYRVTETSVPHRPRLHGKSKFGIERYARGGFDLLMLLATTRYARRPGHLFGWLGIASGGTGVIILGYLSILWFQGVRPIGTRPLFSLGILLVLMGVQFFSVGFLASLLSHRPGSARATAPVAEEV